MDDNTLAPWLALREPADVAARARGLTDTVADATRSHDPLRLLDVATGTGSNIRYLMDRFPSRRQHWVAIDHSPELLAQLVVRMSGWGAARGYTVTTEGSTCIIRGAQVDCHIETRQMDLGTLGAVDLCADRHVVTASALLDLVSDSWLRSLAVQCRRAGAAVLFTITYNGKSSCSPIELEDDLVLELFNRHQRTDKGLGGRAAGPDAVMAASRAFAAEGYQVRSEPSDWSLESGEAELQRQLIDGWAEAAAEMDPAAASTIADWRVRRLQHVDAGRSRLVVSHDDIAAWLPGGRRAGLAV